MGKFFPHGRETNATLVQYLGCEALFFAQHAQQEVLRPNVLVRQSLCLFCGIGQYAFALVAQRQVDGSRHFFLNRGMPFDLLTDGLDRSV